VKLRLTSVEMQKRAVVCTALFTTAMVVAVCSVPLLNQGRGPLAPPVPAQVIATTTATRTIKHAFGEAIIPAAPQRVLALGEDALLVNLLDLGIKPVASNANIPEQIPLTRADELAGIELFTSAAEFSIERLSAFGPDLIIGTRFFVENAGYDKLSRIAPTVALGSEGEIETFVELARVLGKEDEAQAQVDAFTRQMASEAERIGARSKSLSVATVYPGPNVAAWVDGPSPIPQMLLDLGFMLSPNAQAAESFGIRSGRAFISPEKLDLFAADTLLLLQTSAVEGEMEAVEKIKTNPLWQKLPAVQAGRVFILDRIGYPGFRGAKQLLADVAKIVQP
jgi:iron complex transport system substrate-binding protein